jgi:hypothetical protein
VILVSHSTQVIIVAQLAVSVKSVSILVQRLSLMIVFSKVRTHGVGISSFVKVHVTSSPSQSVSVDHDNAVALPVQTRFVFV